MHGISSVSYTHLDVYKRQVLTCMGCGVVANVILKGNKGEGSGWIVITAGWGFACMLGVFTAVSLGAPQADLNPAVTLAKTMNGVYQPGHAVVTMVAETFGAFLGAVVALSLIHISNDLEIRVGAIERKLPVLLHAYVGAMIIEKTYGIFDVEIQQAIRNHTTGGKSMGLLDKIIYLADVIEPSRNFSGVEKLRELAKQDLDVAVLAALDQSIIHIIMQKGLVHPDTIFARNELLLKDEYMDG